MRSTVISAAVGAVVAFSPAAPAAAGPGQFPDLSTFTEADPHPYNVYGNYPYTAGLQFTAPPGYRCRMSFTGKAAVSSIQCWGSLPDAPTNAVRVAFGNGAYRPGAFVGVDPSQMDNHWDMGKEGHTVELTYSPDDYRPLAPGSKLTYHGDEVCAVTDVMTACRLGDHGFVLSPQGSWVF